MKKGLSFMKIGHEMQTQTEKKLPKMHTADTQSFNKILKSQGQEVKQLELEQLLKNITTQGDKLAHFRSFRDLAKFKRLIKDFLKETVSSGYQLHKSHSFGFNGHNRKLTILKEIDEKLLELTDEIMNREKKSVNILGLIGEIKGLLINIYS